MLFSHNPIVQAVAGGGFSPDDVTGLVGWFDAENGVLEGVADPAEDGDAVVTWEDQSSSGNDLTVQNCTYRSSRSGLPALDLADSHLHFASASAITDSNVSIFVVIETADTQYMIAHETGNASSFLGVVQSGSGSAPQDGSTDNAGTEYYIDGTIVSPQTRTQLNTDIQAGGTNAIISCIDLDLSGWSGGFSPLSYTVSGFAFVGYVREILVYDNAVGSSDQADIESYLARWP